ncbi:cytosine deaminase [Rubrimonas cliftonensis]|uniref:Cytosine deaminase n=1 Tax=Rubrimonas cliftonensis TaxID=89524 RepID=A0A1H4D625_9RHOB|nr:cytosine deaminase [Rubrimonas cliftonensis]SEA68174.1 cytosine deaminase [Rubrimonas cliftonensis]
MTDLLFRNVTLPDGRAGLDVACAGGRIAAMAPNIAGGAGRVVDAGGRLLSVAFADCHFHLDATLSLGRPRLNVSGTLLEGIELWGELKAIQTHEEIVARALDYVDLAVAQGITAIRSHVDVCGGLRGVEALLEVRARAAKWLDLQLVAFPQDGLFRDPGAEANLLAALDRGVEIVGGIPHFERTMEEGARSVRRLCAIAAERGLAIDLHCDETDDPMSRHVETLAMETQRLGLTRATASHLTSMHSMDNYYVSKLIPLIAEAGLGVIANPAVNLLIQGRHDGYPKRRGLTRAPELRAAGVTVAYGQDCMMDPWYPLGTADMLEVASLGVHATQCSGRAGVASAFAAVTTDAASVMGLEGRGLAPGDRADLVLLDATDPVDAVRRRAARLVVARAGEVVAESAARAPRLSLPGRPETPRAGLL